MCRLTLDTLDLGTGDFSGDMIAIIAAKGPLPILGTIVLDLYAILVHVPTSRLVGSGDWEFPLGGFRFITLALTSPGGVAGCAFTSISLLVLVLVPAAFALVWGFGPELV